MKKRFTYTLLAAMMIATSLTSGAYAAGNATKSPILENGDSGSNVRFTIQSTTPTITDPEEVQERLDLIDAEALEIYAQTKSLDAVGEYLEDNGFINVGETGETGIMPMSSVNQDVVVITPNVYYDTMTSVYRVSSGFAWKNNSSGVREWRDDKSWWCCDLMYPSDDVGGMDQFGIYFDTSTGLQNYGGHKLTLWNSNDSITETLTTPAASTAQGVAFTGQDTIRYRGAGWGNQSGYDYNWDDGVLTTYFKTTAAAAGKSREVRAQFDHSWDDTNINSIGIQPWGITIGWSVQGKAWTAVPTNPYYWYT
ncbi:hypothetical protein RB620_08415 [Paenibacillus sp. LHD-117]|uniref:hypothetical protein n=1 Tax=Paenibacillus sp. LHD-117 TaxID=3071412 RepID=UPI0027DFA30D|nr:hypothetical protein [Paenibacillus sp. LHD-117]MDQ6419453.1 hypothetical protein [Paenibacillus sp. LHD-117]